MPPGIGDLVHKWIEEGANNPQIIARGKELGLHFSNGSIANHKAKHLQFIGDSPLAPVLGGTPSSGEPMSELQVVDAIIQQGGKRLGVSGQNVTTEQLLRAIELKFKLTQGSVFEAMYAAMSGIGGPDDDELEDLDPESQVPERPSALMSDEEADQKGAE